MGVLDLLLFFISSCRLLLMLALGLGLGWLLACWFAFAFAAAARRDWRMRFRSWIDMTRGGCGDMMAACGGKKCKARLSFSLLVLLSLSFPVSILYCY